MPACQPFGHEPDRELARREILEGQELGAGCAREHAIDVRFRREPERDQSFRQIGMFTGGLLLGHGQTVPSNQPLLDEERRKSGRADMIDSGYRSHTPTLRAFR
jgi:hypothetical protein